MGIVDGICEIAGCGKVIRYDPTASKRRCLDHLDEAHESGKLGYVGESLAEFEARTRGRGTVLPVTDYGLVEEILSPDLRRQRIREEGPAS